jgi:hypothetical protein
MQEGRKDILLKVRRSGLLAGRLGARRLRGSATPFKRISLRP